MQAHHRVDPETKLAFVTIEGQATVADQARLLGELVADPAFEPDFGVIADYRELAFDPSPQHLRELASAYRKVRRSLRGPVAIVVASKAHLTMGRMASPMARLFGLRMAVVDSMAAARSWVGT